MYRDDSVPFTAFVFDSSRQRLLAAQSEAGDGVWEVVGRTRLRALVGGPDLVGFELDNPRGVAVDEASGYVYVADSGNRRILAVPKGEGPPVELPGVTGLQVPTDLAFDSGEKVLYVADGRRVLRTDLKQPPVVVAGTGEEGFAGDGGPAVAARFGGAVGLAFDSTRRLLYIADTRNHRVRCVNQSGTIRTVVGTGEDLRITADREPALEAVVRYPRHLAVDGDGHLYVLADATTSPRVVHIVDRPTC